MKRKFYIFIAAIFAMSSCGLQKAVVSQQDIYDDVYLTSEPKQPQKNIIVQKNIQQTQVDTLITDGQNSYDYQNYQDTVYAQNYKNSRPNDDYDDYFGGYDDYDMRMRLLYGGFYPDYWDDWDFYYGSPYYAGRFGYWNGYYDGYWDGYWDGSWGFPPYYYGIGPAYYGYSLYWGYGYYPWYYNHNYYYIYNDYNQNSDYNNNSNRTYGYRGGSVVSSSNSTMPRRRYASRTKSTSTQTNSYAVRNNRRYYNSSRSYTSTRPRTRYYNPSGYSTTSSVRTRRTYTSTSRSIRRRSYNSSFYSYPRTTSYSNNTYHRSYNFNNDAGYSRSSFRSNNSFSGGYSSGPRSSSVSTSTSRSGGRRR